MDSIRFLLILIWHLFMISLGKTQECGSIPADTTFLNQNIYNSYDQQEISIPIVLHVLHHNQDTLSDRRIKSQIEVLNADYNALNQDLDHVPMEFRPVIGNANIHFHLAQQDPDNQPHNGIIRRPVEQRYFGDLKTEDGRPFAKYTELGGSDAWDSKRYLNIWVCQLSNILGISTFPGHPSVEEEGILIDPEVIGRGGIEPFHLGRTATHEIGHYLGLLHPWGLCVGCHSDDRIEDTPTQSISYSFCPDHPAMSCGSVDMISNFMGYTDDDCMNFFTAGQVDFMRSTVRNYRPEFIINSTSTRSVEDLSKFLTYRPNPTRDILEVELHHDLNSIELHVHNLQGELIKSVQVNSGYHIYWIETNSLRNGLYFLTLLHENGIITRSFTKIN